MVNSINNDKALIYDYENGYIVDQGTGEVVGVIYDYDIPSHGEWVEEQVVREDRAVEEEFNRRSRRLHKLRRAYVEYRRYEERGFIVDWSKVFSGERVKTLTRRISLRAQELFKEMGLLKELEEVVKALDEEGYTSGLSKRSRLVLAYIIYKMMRGEKPVYRDVKNVVANSRWYALMKKAKRVMELINEGSLHSLNSLT
ncbi:MAG: hypothetical protein QXS73_06070 [Desulfurococcaceae archaeon]